MTAEIAARGAAVVGVDRAPAFVDAARARGLDARLVDAAHLPFAAEFDAAFSNAAMHWMPDHDAVVAGVRRALVPGGRFAGELGGHGNVAAIRVAMAAVLARRGVAFESPWNFPTAERFRRVLERHRFRVDLVTLFARPTPLPTGMTGWLDMFAEGLFARVPEGERASARDEVAALLAPALRDDEGRWTADYVRLRFLAHAVD